MEKKLYYNLTFYGWSDGSRFQESVYYRSLERVLSDLEQATCDVELSVWDVEAERSKTYALSETLGLKCGGKGKNTEKNREKIVKALNLPHTEENGWERDKGYNWPLWRDK